MEKSITTIIEEVKAHNFDNGNFIYGTVEISFDGDNFKIELTEEVITLTNLDELNDYDFLF